MSYIVDEQTNSHIVRSLAYHILRGTPLGIHRQRARWFQSQICEFEQPLGLLPAELRVRLHAMRDRRGFCNVGIQVNQDDSHMDNGDVDFLLMIISLKSVIPDNTRGSSQVLPRTVSNVIPWYS